MSDFVLVNNEETDKPKKSSKKEKNKSHKDSSSKSSKKNKFDSVKKVVSNNSENDEKKPDDTLKENNTLAKKPLEPDTKEANKPNNNMNENNNSTNLPFIKQSDIVTLICGEKKIIVSRKILPSEWKNSEIEGKLYLDINEESLIYIVKYLRGEDLLKCPTIRYNNYLLNMLIADSASLKLEKLKEIILSLSEKINLVQLVVILKNSIQKINDTAIENNYTNLELCTKTLLNDLQLDEDNSYVKKFIIDNYANYNVFKYIFDYVLARISDLLSTDINPECIDGVPRKKSMLNKLFDFFRRRESKNDDNAKDSDLESESDSDKDESGKNQKLNELKTSSKVELLKNSKKIKDDSDNDSDKSNRKNNRKSDSDSNKSKQKNNKKSDNDSDKSKRKNNRKSDNDSEKSNKKNSSKEIKKVNKKSDNEKDNQKQKKLDRKKNDSIKEGKKNKTDDKQKKDPVDQNDLASDTEIDRYEANSTDTESNNSDSETGSQIDKVDSDSGGSELSEFIKSSLLKNLKKNKQKNN